MAQFFLKLTGNVHLGSIMPKKNGQVDWTIAGIDTTKMRTMCKQGHKAITQLDSEYRQYLPIDNPVNTHILSIIDSVNNDSNPDNSAEIVNAAEYNTKRAVMKSVKAELKELSKA